MNQKRCKRLRKALRNFGSPVASLDMKYTTAIHKTLENKNIAYPLPLTFKYGIGSFQRIYKDAKSGKFKIIDRS